MTAKPQSHTPELELLPCPFCGQSDAAEVVLYNRPSVLCKNCDCNGPSAQRLAVAVDNRTEAKKESKELWNTRALPATLASVRAALEDISKIEGVMDKAATARVAAIARAALASLTPQDTDPSKL